MKHLVLVHTVAPLIDVFNRLGAALLPGVRMLHVLDEPLLERVRQRGTLAAEDERRLETHVTEAISVGADAVLVTCSTVSPCVDAVRALAAIPVFKIDEAMVARAVNMGDRIGVVATNQTTLEPTRQQLVGQAKRTGAAVDVASVWVEGALPALLRGDGVTHDRLVVAAIFDLALRVDVIVLAQASMARVLDVLAPDVVCVPVLSSPHLALAQVAHAIGIDENG